MSTIQDDDLFALRQGATTYKATAAQLKAGTTGDVVVRRGSTNYKLSAAALATVGDADLLAVGRGGAAYKVTGADLKTYLNPPSVDLWTPADLGAALQGWWDSSDAGTFTLVNGDRVQEWRAKGASASRLTVGATEGDRQPQRTASGVLGLSNSTQLFGSLGSGGDMQVAATFVCFNQTVAAAPSAFPTLLGTRERTVDPPYLLIGASDAGGFNFFQFSEISSVAEGWADGTQFTPQELADFSNWQVGVLMPGGASSMLYTGMAPVLSFPSNNPWVLLNDAVSAGSETRGFNVGPVQQVMVFSRALTTDERQRVEGWTAHTVGELSRLPADHPYKSAPPTK